MVCQCILLKIVNNGIFLLDTITDPNTCIKPPTDENWGSWHILGEDHPGPSHQHQPRHEAPQLLQAAGVVGSGSDRICWQHNREGPWRDGTPHPQHLWQCTQLEEGPGGLRQAAGWVIDRYSWQRDRESKKLNIGCTHTLLCQISLYIVFAFCIFCTVPFNFMHVFFQHSVSASLGILTLLWGQSDSYTTMRSLKRSWWSKPMPKPKRCWMITKVRGFGLQASE